MKSISLKEYYRQNNYDTGGGYGKLGKPSPVLGSQTSGQEKIRHIYDISTEDSDSEEIDNNEMDDFVTKINSKVNGHKPKSDLGNRKDNATLANNNHMSIFEYALNHKNHAMKGISPRLTYRSKTNTKGPALGTQSSASYIRNSPGRKSGTQYGTSRKHKILTDIEDNNIFNLSDILNPVEISFKRHNNKTKKILSIIKEYLKFDSDGIFII
jgi:hypothetical protein